MAKTTIQYEERETVVDSTGAMQEQRTSQVTKTIHKTEPAYIKLYIQDILYMKDMPQGLTGLLYELVRHVSYATEGLRIYLPKGLKNEIAERINTTPQSLNNSLSRLCKGSILKREGMGIYSLNPYLFGRGDWKDIDNIRATWNYDAINGRTFSAAFTYKTDAPEAPEIVPDNTRQEGEEITIEQAIEAQEAAAVAAPKPTKRKKSNRQRD